jgi:dTDP-4-amino-4,6-dideoxygalactose transaminase
VKETVVQRIPLLDLKAQHASIGGEVMAAVGRVFENQAFILGEEVRLLEEELAAYCASRFAVGCASGTDALLLALKALDVGPGDEVLTVPFTFFATAGAIVNVGAKPVFVDILPDSFNMDPAQVEDALQRHPRIKAVIPVHLYGDCAEMDAILAAAARHGVPVIEDAAQAIGAEYRGRRSGTMGRIGCFSFFPSKNLGGSGDGGMMTTQDPALAARLRSLRVHGSEVKYYHDEVGFNSRLDALQAAVLRVKLRHLDDWTAGRQRNAARYRELLAGLGQHVQLPLPSPASTRHVYNQFVIRAQRRDELRAYLTANGIGTELYYPLPLHLQKCFLGLGYRQGDFAVSEACSADCLALPIFAELKAEALEWICSRIRAFYGLNQ